MNKLLSSFIVKSILLVIASVLWTFAYAQVSLSPEVEPGSYGSPTITTDILCDACLSYNFNIGKPQNFIISGTGLNPGTITYKWSVKGGITLQSTNGDIATVAPVMDSKGRYNKGRLKVFYKGTIDSTVNVGNCDGLPPLPVKIHIPKSGVVYVDLYQKFTFPDQVVGNVCVAKGDSNAYSIKDLVSGNVADGIGIDSYYWDYSSITSIIKGSTSSYISGDSSAVTFIFTDSPSGSDAKVKVRVGRCNTDYVQRFLASRLPKATVSIKQACIPASTHQVSITNNAQTGIVYKWVLGNTNFTFAPGYGENSQTGITVNIGSEKGDIYLLSRADAHSGKYCGSTVDTIKISRSLDESIAISGPTCVTPGTYTYTLVPNPNTRLTWVLNSSKGWSIDPSNQHASTVPIIVGPDAESGIIEVMTEDCPSGSVRLNVNVAPNAPGPIYGGTCLTRGMEATFSIDRVKNANSYTWTFPPGFTPISSTDDTLVRVAISPDAQVGNVTVLANGCQGATSASTLGVNFTPTSPGVITRYPSTCLNVGIPQTITFTAANCIDGQTYQWIIPSGWTKIGTDNACSLTVQTDGKKGNGYIVKAMAINECGQSGYDAVSVNVTGIGVVKITSSPIFDDDDIQIGEVFFASVTGGVPPVYQWYRDGIEIGSGAILTLQGATPATICVRGSRDGCITQTCKNTIYASSRTSGVNENLFEGSEIRNVKIFPNPANEQLRIMLPVKFTDAGFTIIDGQGKEVYSKSHITKGETSVNVSRLKTGTYIVLVTLNGKTIAKRVQIVK